MSEDIASVVGRYTPLSRLGDLLVGMCPICGVQDEGEKFNVNQDGTWACYTSGCHEQGNQVADFIRAVNGRPVLYSQPQISERATAVERVTIKPPANADTPRMTLRKLGDPVKHWTHLDATGATLMFTALYSTEQGKEYRYWCWCDGEEPGWACTNWTRYERPLYNLQLLEQKKDAKVLLVDSFEALDLAANLLGGYVVTTWPGNAGGWKLADLKPLTGREVHVWVRGIDATQQIINVLSAPRGLRCRGKAITPKGGDSDFRDAGSWAGTAEELLEWLRANAKPYEAPPEPPEPPQEPFPPIEAYAADPLPNAPSEPVAKPRKRSKPRLAAVDGNTALAPEADAEPAPVALSEDAFAEQFAEDNGDDWRCVNAWDKWFHWDGEAWLEDRTNSRVDSVRQIFRAAQFWPNAGELTSSQRRAIFGRQVPMYAALRLAGTDKRIRAEPEIWDSEPWMLGVPGGVVDLQTGKLMESAREQHVTMRCSVAPERGTPTLWLDMLNRWMGGDEGVIGYLRRYLGYALTGDNREQCMTFFYGQAQSGKGTILRTIAGILGTDQQGSGKFRSYHYEAPISTFMESRSERHSTELAAFYKKRLITSEEPSAGAKWDEGKLKWITGGSQITARFIAQDNFSFTMTGKIIVAANHRPRLSTTDKAIRRRIHVVPFEHPVSDEDRDNLLDAKLREEWPRILHWLIEGCAEWQDVGLGLPERIASSTDEYLEAEDTIGAWLDECTERSADTDGATLYRNYADWCARNGDNAWTRRAWANALMDRGFQSRKGSGGIRMIRALSLKLGASLPA